MAQPQPIKLSTRLKTVASFLPPGAFFADIGSDHAYLPCYVCLHDNTARAIAGEVNKGPYQRAQETVDAYQLSNAIDVRLGDGMQVLEKDEVTELVIAGMGGSLIRDILKSGAEKQRQIRRIIVQPNVDARDTRRWLACNGFLITDERIIEENGHVYEIVVADSGSVKTVSPSELQEKQFLFGPFLMEAKSPIFYKKWRLEQIKLQNVLKQMHQATVINQKKIEQFSLELQWIKEVLQDDKGDN